VLGAGIMGSLIGCEYALGGHAVTWVARSPERARRAIEDGFAMSVRHGLHPPEVAERASRSVRVVTSVDAVEDADLVVESVPEDVPLKGEVLRAAAAALPGALLASNTSSIPIGTLAAELDEPARLVGTHYWNPPLLMPLVEVVPGEAPAERVAWVVGLLEGMGKRPVPVRREAPGFIWNRLQFALLREALWLVEEGVATPDVVDEVVRYGLARRMRLTGPFETAALGGVGTFQAAAENLFPTLSCATGIEGGLGRWLTDDQARLDAARRRRDATLAADLLADRADAEGGGG
jgi:3-hydroxybutyryl-CoA dehydrogenase